MSSTRKIILKSSDGESFEVDQAVALKLQILKDRIDDNCVEDEEIPIPRVTSKILTKVIEYCKKHVEVASSEEDKTSSTKDDLKAWDADFVKVDRNTLLDIVLAANYLDIKSLLDLTCGAVADLIKGKTTDEVRKIFQH